MPRVQLGVNTAIAIGAARGDLDLADQSGQPLAAQLGCGSSVFACVRSSSDDRLREFGSSGLRVPRPRAVSRSPGRGFWEGLVLTQELRGLPHDRQLSLQLVDTPSRRPQFRRSAGCNTGTYAAVDVVLLDPLDNVTGWMPRSSAVCFCGLPTRTRAIAGTELCRIRAGRDGQPFVRAVT